MLVIAKQDITIFRIVEVEDITRYYTLNKDWPDKPTTKPPFSEWVDTEPETTFKRSASGTSLKLTDVSPIEHTMGVKLSSKNLIPYPYLDIAKGETKIINGLSCIDNGDGTITFNGTATSGVSLNLCLCGSIAVENNSDVTYTLTGCPTGGSFLGGYILYIDPPRQGSAPDVYDEGSGATTNGQYITSNPTQHLIVYVPRGTYNDFTFKPQLEYGTAATEYTPYIEDLSTVELTRQGKNLIPYPYVDIKVGTPYSYRGVTAVVDEQGVITVEGAFAAGESGVILIKLLQNFTIEKDAYLSGAPSGSSYSTYALEVNSDKGYYADTGKGIKIPAGATISNLYIYVRPGTTIETPVTFKPQLELGSAATEYELYDEPSTYTPLEDGTVEGVTSISPTTTLMTNTEGVIINAEYNKDTSESLYFTDLTTYTDDTYKYSEVSKSSDYEAAKEAFNKASAIETNADSINLSVSALETRVTTAETEIEKNTEQIALRATKTEVTNYVTSRGENLVTNGTALLGNNTNFSKFTYDGANTYYSGGSFKRVGGGWDTYCNDEYIPVDVNQQYILSYMIKNNNANARYYDMLLMYDIDKLPIYDYHIMWVDGSTTTLAQDLNYGDTVVYLQDVSGFDTTKTGSHYRGLIFWNYKNSFGYQYGTETYSRNRWQNIWNDGTAIDIEANTITLKIPWGRGKISAGTSVSQCSGGATYMYLNGDYAIPEANVWSRMSGVITSVGKNNERYKFREGTAFVRVGWFLNNGDLESVTTWLTNISLTQSAGIADLENVRNEAASTSKAIQDRVAAIETNADSINLSVNALETRVTNNQSTIDEKISSLEEKVALSMTEDQVDIQIDKKLQNGVNKVETSTGFRFDEDGLNISKSNSKTNTQINDEGMTVRSTETNDVMLTADKDGVEATNLHATTYLKIGTNSRFEDYKTTRTACFWIGE